MLQQSISAGAPADWVVFTRVDLQWLANHPPLAMFSDVDAANVPPLATSYGVPVSPDADGQRRRSLWIPDGQDWRGYNDRTATVPVELASRYFGLFESLRSGELGRRFFPHIFARPPPVLTDIELSPEFVLGRYLDGHGVPVRRYAPIQAVRSCRPGPQCLDKQSLVSGYRYMGELLDAQQVALFLTRLGYVWTPNLRWKLDGPCDGSTDLWELCCRESYWNGINGTCFDGDSYTAQRCCRSHLDLGVWLAESSPLMAFEWGMRCWNDTKYHPYPLLCLSHPSEPASRPGSAQDEAYFDLIQASLQSVSLQNGAHLLDD